MDREQIKTTLVKVAVGDRTAGKLHLQIGIVEDSTER